MTTMREHLNALKDKLCGLDLFRERFAFKESVKEAKVEHRGSTFTSRGLEIDDMCVAFPLSMRFYQSVVLGYRMEFLEGSKHYPKEWSAQSSFMAPTVDRAVFLICKLRIENALLRTAQPV